MSSISSEDIISILKEEIKNYDDRCRGEETGTVISVGDGIARIYGMDQAMYGEILLFENGLKGMVQDIKEDSIGCILFGKDTEDLTAESESEITFLFFRVHFVQVKQQDL